MEAWRANFANLFLESMVELAEEESIHNQLMLDWSTIFQGDPEPVQQRPRAKRRVKDRDRNSGHERIWRDYFAPQPVFTPEDFRRRFRMSQRLFCRLLVDIPAHDSYFKQHRDAANQLGLTRVQKMLAAIRQLAYGYGADATDEYCRIGETTARDCLYKFCRAVREVYEEHYLRKPTDADLVRILAYNKNRGFPGMIGSLDCMHYAWSNCPVAWQGAYGDRDGTKSVILEAVADGELYIWHAFFGLPGANNDLNVLGRSPLINDMLKGGYDDHIFELSGVPFKGAYLLVDGIYPKWKCFIQTIVEPQSERNKLFAKVQEGLRKDVERAFGVLQIRWGIIAQAACPWHVWKIVDIMKACIILHNMIIKDERDEDWENICPVPPDFRIRNRGPLPWSDYLNAVADLEDAEAHYYRRDALINHLWTWHGSQTACD